MTSRQTQTFEFISWFLSVSQCLWVWHCHYRHWSDERAEKGLLKAWFVLLHPFSDDLDHPVLWPLPANCLHSALTNHHSWHSKTWCFNSSYKYIIVFTKMLKNFIIWLKIQFKILNQVTSLYFLVQQPVFLSAHTWLHLHRVSGTRFQLWDYLTPILSFNLPF